MGCHEEFYCTTPFFFFFFRCLGYMGTTEARNRATCGGFRYSDVGREIDLHLVLGCSIQSGSSIQMLEEKSLKTFFFF